MYVGLNDHHFDLARENVTDLNNSVAYILMASVSKLFARMSFTSFI